MGRRRTLISALAALAVMVSAAAGCGRSGEQAGPGGGRVATVVATAGTKSTRAATAKVDFSTNGSINGEHISSAATGAVDLAGKAVELKVAMPGFGTMEERLVDGAMYMKLPKLPKAPRWLRRKPWIRLDMERFSKKVFGQELGSLLSGEGSNPADYLAWLRAGTNPKKVGSEQIDGKHTTEYEADFDMKKVKGLETRARRTLMALMSTTGVSYRPMHVWIGDDGLVRRVELTVSVDAPGRSGTTKVTMDYRDWGSAVSIEAPPSNDTAEVTDRMLAELGGS